ncbi:MAG: ABC transporter, partial [bacterium]
SGVGTMDLKDEKGLLARWRHTLSRNSAVRRLTEQFQERIAAMAENRPVTPREDTVCPICENLISSENDECPNCAKTIHAPPSAWTLFRLWRFAKPYTRQLIGGFILTLLATAATLVPPYLTMPLMDKVLIPYQNGKPIDSQLVTWLLSGLVSAAFLAWLLDWARTYILALI